MENEKLKTETEKQIKTFCINCVDRERDGKRKLIEVIKEKEKFINSLTAVKEEERWDAMSQELIIIKIIKCEDCQDEFVSSYWSRLEANLTLQGQLQLARESGKLFNTYRIE